jgi:preprotein translocase subunit SecF
VRAGGDQALHDLSGKMLNYLSSKYGKDNVSVVSIDMVGPRVGASLRKQGMFAIVYAMIGIVIYVGIRFNFRFSPGGLVCLFHDLVIVGGLFSLLNLEMDLTVIAALLTIAGYDINDTIVVFDRIREGRTTKYRTLPIRDMVNRAINETLSRTVLTSGVTLLAVIALLFLGGQILFNFALAMTVGIVLGTYSSIFIASPIYVFLEEIYVKRRKAKGAKA